MSSFFFHSEAMTRIKASMYDPGDPLWRLYYKRPDQRVRNQQGIVTDNKDPDKLGRVRVHFPLWGDDCITGFIPVVHMYAGKDQGIWTLPGIGERVLCMFINDNPDRPFVYGSFYNHQDKAPVGDNKGNDIKMIWTPAGTSVIIDDKPGAEKIQISMMQGKMRIVLDDANGIDIINEIGDIQIECNKLTIEAEEGEFIFEKDFVIEGDSVDIKGDKGIGLKAGGKVNIKGKIDLKGSSGVMAGGKQMAKKNDQVVGIDKHDIMVPSANGLVTVPMIPHPYIGKLVDKLSDDVKIKGQPAAMKGSKSKNNAPMHLPMPPGVQFKKAPNNEGEVSSGTIPKVKVNGKEAAVLGSKVKTCSDPMPGENCTIIAMGMAPKLPIQIPVTKPIDRSLSNPKWSVTKAGIGETVKLSVQLKKQYENATVEFKVFPDGGSKPIQKIYGRNIGGKSEVEWKFPADVKKPGEAKYTFTAESFGCKEVKSGKIEQKKAEFSELKWLKDGKEVTEVYIGDKVTLSAKCKNMDHAKNAVFKVYEKDETSPNDYITSIKAEIIDGKKIEATWEVIYVADDDDAESSEELAKQGYTIPEYIFYAATSDESLISQESPLLNTKTMYEIKLVDRLGEPVANLKYKVFNWKNEEIASGTLDENGYAKVDNVKFSEVRVEYIYD